MHELTRLDGRALLVLATSSADPAVAPFAGAGRLAPCFAVAPIDAPPRLGFLNPMERGEAEGAPYEVLGPGLLDVVRASRSADGPDGLWADVVARAFYLCGVAPGRIALAGTLDAGTVHGMCRRLESLGWTFVPGGDVALRLRKRKSNAEIAAIRTVAEGVAEAMGRVAEILAGAAYPGGERQPLRFEGEALRVRRLRSEVAMIFARRGLEQPERNIIAPAEEGAMPHSTGTDERVLRAGESLVVDLFPRGAGYFADATRTFCVGRATDALARAHAAVVAAVEKSESLAVPGARLHDLHLAVCELFGDLGWPHIQNQPGTERGYVHGLGHGVGQQLHELPSFRESASEADGRLDLGDVFTLEPGLYEPASEADSSTGWAVRIEDTYALTADGLVSLTPMPRDLDPRAW